MPSIIRATTTSGLQVAPDNSGSLQLQTNGTTTAVTIDTSQNVGIGTASPTNKLTIGGTNSNIFFKNADATTGYAASQIVNTGGSFYFGLTSSTGAFWANTAGNYAATIGTSNATNLSFATNDNVRMVITSNGDLCIGKTAENDTTAGMRFTGTTNSQYTSLVRDGAPPLYINRLTNDGDLVQFAQANAVEGTISVSGTTVSYNGGHLSRWSQFDNETEKVNVYRGTVLESVNTMCVWEKDGQPLPNEQATKTIVSTTPSSKAVAGVFDRYDEDDETNPYDFYVAQSGDFVIRIAQGITVQNGDLLESAGDGTARPQADDICRSSTIAKVTSNYVSATYEDGSYCVPCILMIG